MTGITNFLAAESQGQMGFPMLIVIYVAIFAALYFFMIRPNSKRKKEEEALKNSVEIGDDITTIGGIVGRIVAIKEDEDCIVIETGTDRTKLKMKKWCISSVDKEIPQKATPEKKGFFSRKKKDAE